MKKSEYKYDDIEEWLDDLIASGLDILTKQKRQQYFTQNSCFSIQSKPIILNILYI